MPHPNFIRFVLPKSRVEHKFIYQILQKRLQLVKTPRKKQQKPSICAILSLWKPNFYPKIHFFRFCNFCQNPSGSTFLGFAGLVGFIFEGQDFGFFFGFSLRGCSKNRFLISFLRSPSISFNFRGNLELAAIRLVDLHLTRFYKFGRFQHYRSSKPGDIVANFNIAGGDPLYLDESFDHFFP